MITKIELEITDEQVKDIDAVMEMKPLPAIKETQIMCKISELLEPLDSSDSIRIISWCAERFRVSLDAQVKGLERRKKFLKEIRDAYEKACTK